MTNLVKTHKVYPSHIIHTSINYTGLIQNPNPKSSHFHFHQSLFLIFISSSHMALSMFTSTQYIFLNSLAYGSHHLLTILLFFVVLCRIILSLIQACFDFSFLLFVYKIGRSVHPATVTKLTYSRIYT